MVKEKKSITAEAFVRELRTFFRDAKDEDTVQVKELRTLLDCVELETLETGEDLGHAIIFSIERYAENNDGAGLPGTDIWRALRARGLRVDLDTTSNQIELMEETGILEAIPGMVTRYKVKEGPEVKKP